MRGTMSNFQLVMLITFITMAISSYLDTQKSDILKIDEILLSPLGHYKLAFLSNCTFQISYYNTVTGEYQLQKQLYDNISQNIDCKYIKLSLEEQNLVLDDGTIYRKLENNQNVFRRMVFGISDSGLVYIVGYWMNGVDNLWEYNRTYLNNVSSDSKRYRGLINNLESNVNFTNSNGWNFINNNGTITINKQLSNGTKFINTIQLNGYQFSQLGFSDSEGQIRYSAIDGMTYQPRAGGSLQQCINPQGIFGVFDEYWPIMQIYDRDRYLVAQYSIDNNYWSCPEKMFEIGGKCNVTCPISFYKQIRGRYGKCVLNCQTGSLINENTKTCYSRNEAPPDNLNLILNRGCPNQSKQYEYGCICDVGLYYNFINNSCVISCPISTIGLEGICASCPSKCISCNIDTILQQNYLICNQCESGYSGNRCQISINSCNNIKNCVVCKDLNGTQICQRCAPFYVLNSNFLQCGCKFIISIDNCFTDEVLAIGQSFEGYCKKINAGSNSPSTPNGYVTGYYMGTVYMILKPNQCPPYMFILRNSCVQHCPDGMAISLDSRCVCGLGEASFQNQSCYQIDAIQKYQLGYYYNETYNSYLNCPVGCLKCMQGSYCLKCSSVKYVLMVTRFSAQCRQNSIHFTCNSEDYTYYSSNNQNQTSSSSTSSKICIENFLLKLPMNSSNCKIELRTKCILCNDGYFLNYLSECVDHCGVGYFVSEGLCINYINANKNSIDNSSVNGGNMRDCQVPVLNSVAVSSKIDSSLIGNYIYNLYTLYGKEISKQPFIQIFAIREILGIPITTSLTATLYYPKLQCRLSTAHSPQNTTTNITCMDPSLPYSLLNGTCASECPSGTISGQYNICQPIDIICYQQNKSTPYQLVNGSCVQQCPNNTVPIQFGTNTMIICIEQTQCQKNDTITPYLLSSGGNICVSACPKGTSPLMMQNSTNLVCSSSSSTPEPIRIDASVFQVSSRKDSNQKIFYFVVNKLLKQSDVKVNYYSRIDENKKKISLSLSSLSSSISQSQYNINVTQFTNKSYIGIKTSADEIILDFSKNIEQFLSSDGNRLASSIYGVTTSQNHIQNSKSWLAIITYVLSLVLICIHAIYVGNELIYKVDNWLILAQTMYFFSFVHLLINAPIGQFYYGFLFAHFGFFPNYFKYTIPNNYMQGFLDQLSNNSNHIPNSYRLLTGDANFIRNAGFSFSLLSTFIVAFILVICMIFVLEKCCGFYQIWYKRIAIKAFIAGFQFVSMNIFYWAVAHLFYNRDKLFSGQQEQASNHVKFRTACSAASIAWICIYGIYMIIRFIKDRIGGLYMFKRLSIAVILAASAYQIDDKYKIFLVPLAILELLFMLIRFVLESPYLTRQKVFIGLQTFFVLVAYFTIYLWNDTGFISIYISLLLFLFIFLFTYDLMDVYLDNKDQFYQDKINLIPGLRHKQFNYKIEDEQFKLTHGHVDGNQQVESDRKFINYRK